jgi:hypothetical protein
VGKSPAYKIISLEKIRVAMWAKVRPAYKIISLEKIRMAMWAKVQLINYKLEKCSMIKNW